MTGPRITAVVPVFNHEGAVGKVVKALLAHDLPIVLVDDGSSATCRLALENLARECGARLLRLPVNGGKGAAVIAGLREAESSGFSHALQVDADGQHDLTDVPRFIDAAIGEPGSIICGRPVFDASIPRVRLFSRYITHVLVWLQTLSRTLVRDSMCGFRLYPIGHVLEVVDQDGVGRRMDFDVELLVKLVWRGRTLRWIDTRVSYPADGISHFRMLLDNLLLAKMHIRLVGGMILRAPRLLARKFSRAENSRSAR